MLCAIKGLKANLSCGPYGLPLLSFKNIDCGVAAPLAIIFTRLFSVSKVPVIWKEAAITPFFTARRSYASSFLGVIILSVRLSHACFVTNPKNLLAIFLYHMKGQSFYFSDAKDLSEIPTGSPPTGAPNRGGVG